MTSNHQWLDFLKQQNAQIENNIVTRFGDIAAERQAAVNATILCDLTHLGFISASGSETQSFLQNQLSNDIKQVTENFSQLNAYCTAKGRALALLRAFLFQDHYYLQLPVEQIEATLKRLQMFVLMTKVNLSDATSDFVAFGLAGPDSETLLQNISSQLPQQDNQCVTTADLLICKISGQTPRFIVAGKFEPVSKAWNALNSRATVCGNHVWSYLDIQEGIPQIYANNREEFVPQMLNLHSIDGISFQKGCYPGQEVVARMHFLGKLKRRMYLAHINHDSSAAEIGASLFTQDDPEHPVGRVVQSQTSPDGGVDMQVVLQIAAAENKPIHLNSPDGPELKFKELPYTVALEREDK